MSHDFPDGPDYNPEPIDDDPWDSPYAHPDPPPAKWGAIATMTDLVTGETKHTCMYCYRPWHPNHYCTEPEQPSEATEDDLSPSDAQPQE